MQHELNINQFIILLLGLVRPVCLGISPSVPAYIHPHMSKMSFVIGN